MKTSRINYWPLFLLLVILPCSLARAQSGPGTALNLDGTSGYAQVANGVWFSNDFTVEGWVYARSYNNWSRLFDFGNGGYLQEVYLALSEGTGGFPKMGVFTNGNNTLVGSSKQLPLNQWTHLAVTLSGSTATILMNGNAVGSGTVLVPGSFVRTNNYIGRSLFAGDGYANALFDDVRIWNVARTTNQIQAFMHRSLAGNESGLLGYWRMNEGTGTTLTDSTGHGQTATLFGGTSWSNSTAPLTVGPGTALNFNNTNCQNVQIPNQPALNAYPLTVMTWFMVPTNSDGGALVNKYVSSSKNGYQLFLAGDLRAWYFHDTANNVFNNGVMDAGPVHDGLWHHAAFAVDAAGGRLYLDGVLKSSVAWTGTPQAPTTSQPLAFGIYPGDSCFNGQMDEVSIWNTALSTAQIQGYMHQSLQGTESGLLAYYRLDEGSGTNTVDGTGHGYNGTLAGPPTWITSGATFTIPPTVTNQPATSITASGATLNATVNPNGGATAVYFVYGTTTNYDSTNAVINIGSGTSAVPVSCLLSNLTAGTLYHFTAMASNAAGVVSGADSTFTTTSLFTSVAAGLGTGFGQSVVWGDFNNDGRLDLLQMPFVMSNRFDGTFDQIFDGMPAVFYGCQVWGDFDNDGYLDLLVTGTRDGGNPYPTTLLHNNHNSTFTPSTQTGLPNCFNSSVAVGDFDNDGLPDVLVIGSIGPDAHGNRGISGIWRNNGNGTFTQIPIPGLPAGTSGSVAVGDFNNDGYLDFVIAGVLYSDPGNYFAQVWRNNGDGTFTQITVPGLQPMYTASLAVGDYNDDGYLDFVITGETEFSAYISQVWKNNGNWNFTLENNAVLPATYEGQVAWGDFDNDGYPDLALAGATTLSSGQAASPIAQIWRNTGNGTFANINASLPAFIYNSMAFGDFNNDGRLDFVQMGYSGGGNVDLEQNNTPVANTPPTAPPGLQAAVHGSGVVLTWNAASDAQTPAAGLSYNLRVGTNSGGGSVVVPMADPSTGLRRLPQLGNAGEALKAVLTNLTAGTYYWSVQAIDTAYAGSPFAAEGQFTITVPTLLTGPASQITSNSAVLNGSVQPNGTDTAAWFIWGASSGSLSNTTAPAFIAGTNGSPVGASQTLNGLQPFTQYFYRMVGTNAAGLSFGAVSNFTTLPSIALAITHVVEPPIAGTDSVVVAVSPAYFGWSASANDSWLHIITGGGAGNAIVGFSYDANPGPTRTGTLTIAGQTFTVLQAGSTYFGFTYQDQNSFGPTTLMTLTSGLNSPLGLGVDSAGNAYFCDILANTVSEWLRSNNTVITLISNDLYAPSGLVLDNAGNVYIADTFNNAVKKWSAADQTVTTIVGSGLDSPSALACDSAGNIYIADTGNNAIKEWTAVNSNVVTLVSTGLNQPGGVAVDQFGNVFIADTMNNALKEWLAANGNVLTLTTNLMQPANLAIDGSGNVYIADPWDWLIEQWSPVTGAISDAINSEIFNCSGVAVDATGNIYVSDYGHHAIEVMPRAFVDSTAETKPYTAGSDVLPPVVPGDTDLRGPLAPYSDEPWLTITAVTNGLTSFSFTANTTGAPRRGRIYLLNKPVIIDQGALVPGVTNLVEGSASGTDSLVLAITPPIAPWTASANDPWLHLAPGYQSGAGSTNVIFSFDANSGPTRMGALSLGGVTVSVTQAGASYVAAPIPLTALVSTGAVAPSSLALDNAGNIYFSNPGDQTIKVWTRANNSVGSFISSGLGHPTGVAFDPFGDFFILDAASNAMYYCTPPDTNLYVLSSGLNSPWGVAVDSLVNVYIADTGNNAIKRWSPVDGSLTVLVPGLSGPKGVAVDAAGNVYFADTGNNAIKEWLAASSNVVTLASTGLSAPTGVAVDGSGNVYFADSGNNAIKKWSAVDGVVTTLISSGLNNPSGICVDSARNVYIVDSANNAIEELPRAFVDPTTRLEPFFAGTDALPSVLPGDVNLLPPFAPTIDQPWLSITNTSAGVVGFAFSANSGPVRTGHIGVLGESVSIIQTNSLVTSPILTAVQRLSNGNFQFTFTNTPEATFHVLTATNLDLPLANWINVGTVSNASPGLFQYTTVISSNSPQQFFRVVWP